MLRLQILFLISSVNPVCDLHGQSVDSALINRQHRNDKPELLTSGFIDLMNNGQVNVSARLLRIFIGEPGRLAIPVSIYSGVSSNNFQNQLVPGGLAINDQLVLSFINPLSGLLNVSMEGLTILENRKSVLTKTGFLYQAGFRILTGYQPFPYTAPITARPVNILNGFAVGGFYFQTGAWDRNNSGNIGLFWGAMRYIASFNSAKQLQPIIGYLPSSGICHGWSLGWGVAINSLVNIKIVYYKYVQAPEFDYSLPIYQFCFNYSLKN